MAAANWLPPRHVTLTVGTLVDPGDVVEAFTEYEPAESTTWQSFLLTAANLVFVSIRYDTDHYDRDEESSPWRRTNPPAMTINAAWSRPLRTITGFHVTEVGDTVVNEFGQAWFRTTSHLSFADGTVLALPNEQRIHRAGVRAQAAKFIAALRSLIV
ncbi:hypothetical protein HQO93_14490 [Rhodococcus fascians]|nr:hypothetical protein [Rhodococcus fascians]MBY4067817.1 hypothetical protein [Rhodococcus fascians]